MNWFRQNRSLGMLLIVVGICLLAVAILFYWTGSKWASARSEFNKARAERVRLQALDPFPNDANVRKLKEHLLNYRVALNQFKEELKKEMLPEMPLAPNEFQSRLRAATVATVKTARANGVKLPDKFYLGFDEFVMMLPRTAVAPLLGQELSQIQMLMNILLDARVDSVTSFHRLPLTEEKEPKAAPKGTPVPARAAPRGRSGQQAKTAEAGALTPKLIERNVVELTFKATPGAARKVLNDISSSNGQFFVIRTLYVHNEKDVGPAREKNAEPTATPTPAGAEASPPPGAAAAAPLNFIVGNEHVEISATIEMLRFLF